jgi:hypothetical protein
MSSFAAAFAANVRNVHTAPPEAPAPDARHYGWAASPASSHASAKTVDPAAAALAALAARIEAALAAASLAKES